MSLMDIFLAAGILAAAGWLFYKSFIKKKGHCTGCPSCASRSCGVKNDDGKDRLIQLS
ncbi:MAG TPA: FeoB-associated Cys-rich membrane protein [Smithella sp.]|nr:FeoB-associated Cys-rich membrane protein [Smithella sp.]